MINNSETDNSINGSNNVLISCRNGLQGINVTGFKVSDLKYFTINLTSHAGSQCNSKTISIQLITELSPLGLSTLYF